MKAMKVQAEEQFLHLENYKSEWDKPRQLEIFPEEVKAEIIDIFDAKPENIKSKTEQIEPLDINDM